ncbi:MAG: hypothetical protein ACTSWL_06525 [Promethearchaeota archaeon]
MHQIIKENSKKLKFNKMKTFAFFLVLFLLITPIEANAMEITKSSTPDNDFKLYYGLVVDAGFLIEDRQIYREEINQVWDQNHTEDFYWQSIAHLFLDFKYLSDEKFSCSIEFRVLNITRYGSLIYDLSENHFYMQNNISKDVYIPFFFQNSQDHKDNDIFCTYDATRNIFIKDIGPIIQGLNQPAKFYTYYNDSIVNLNQVKIFWPDDTPYGGKCSTDLFYEQSGLFLNGRLPFYSFNEFCRLAIPSFNSTNFNTNPELKLARTNLKFSSAETSPTKTSNLGLIIIGAGIIFGVPLVIVITRSIKLKQIKKTKKKKKPHSKFRRQINYR